MRGPCTVVDPNGWGLLRICGALQGDRVALPAECISLEPAFDKATVSMCKNTIHRCMCISWRYTSSWHLQSPSFAVGSKQMVEAVHWARQYSNNPCMTSCRTWKLQILPELGNLFQHLFTQLRWSRPTWPAQFPTWPRPGCEAIQLGYQKVVGERFEVDMSSYPLRIYLLLVSGSGNRLAWQHGLLTCVPTLGELLEALVQSQNATGLIGSWLG